MNSPSSDPARHATLCEQHKRGCEYYRKDVLRTTHKICTTGYAPLPMHTYYSMYTPHGTRVPASQYVYSAQDTYSAQSCLLHSTHSAQ